MKTMKIDYIKKLSHVGFKLYPKKDNFYLVYKNGHELGIMDERSILRLLKHTKKAVTKPRLRLKCARPGCFCCEPAGKNLIKIVNRRAARRKNNLSEYTEYE
jgi:hypothetical protein